MDCADVDLPNHLTKKLIIEGSDASGLLLDLTGAYVDGGKGQFNYRRGDMIEVRSVKLNDGRWSVPTDINIQHARVTGSIRLYGMGRNGEAAAVREASRKSEGQSLIRRAAPKRITLESLWVEGTGRNPVYFGPGVMHASLNNSTVTGISTRVGVYLDAESSHNVLTGNVFSVKTDDGSWLGFYDRGWPQLALDGSANNEISNNTFEQLKQGGIFCIGIVARAVPSVFKLLPIIALRTIVSSISDNDCRILRYSSDREITDILRIGGLAAIATTM